MNLEKLKKLENKVRIGGKKSPRRKVLKSKKTHADQTGALDADPVLHADSVLDTLDQEIMEQIQELEQMQEVQQLEELEQMQEVEQKEEMVIMEQKEEVQQLEELEQMQEVEQKEELNQEDLIGLYTNTDQLVTLEAQAQGEITPKEDLVVVEIIEKQDIKGSPKDEKMEQGIEIFTSTKVDAGKEKTKGLQKFKKWLAKVFRKKQRI